MTRSAYCTVSDLQKRLFASQTATNVAGQSFSPAANPDQQRDSILTDLAVAISRRFDQETGRRPGAFWPTYDVRYFSGTGAQLFELADEFAVLTKVEINTSPSQPTNPTWTDYTSELTTGNMQLRPTRTWPKRVIFRMSTFYQDPFLAGNVRLTGIFGNVQPDLSAALPQVSGGVVNDPLYPTLNGVSSTALTALQPVNPITSAASGWWITPEDVRKACAEWAVYAYQAQRAGFGDLAANPAGGQVLYRKGIPPEVQAVIESYTSQTPKVAMVTTDGDDIALEGQRFGTPGQLSRWAGWQTT